MESERAETYLRLMAEAELRRARRSHGEEQPPAGGLSYTVRERLRRIQYVASVLTAAGALDPGLARAVTGDLEAALAVRSRIHRERRVLALRSYPVPTAGQPELPGVPARPGGGPERRVSVVPAGRTLTQQDEEGRIDLHLFSLVRTPFTVMFAVASCTTGSPRRARLGRHFRWLRVVDDLGSSYHVHFNGLESAGRADGWLSIHPAPPASARWLELSGWAPDMGARLRVDLVAQRVPTEVRAEHTAPFTPGERLLDAIAANMLARLPEPVHPGEPLDEAVIALATVGALPPGSLAPSRLAVLREQMGFKAGPGLAEALAAGRIPATRLPEPWTSVLAYFGRRHQPAGREGVASPIVVLPELDGVTFAVAGLRSEPDQTVLSVLAFGPVADDAHMPARMRWSRWLPWWLRDSTGQWHVAAADGYDSDADELTTLHLRVTPPLPRSASWLELIATGGSASVRAILPLEWAAGVDSA